MAFKDDNPEVFLLRLSELIGTECCTSCDSSSFLANAALRLAIYKLVQITNQANVYEVDLIKSLLNSNLFLELFYI